MDSINELIRRLRETGRNGDLSGVYWGEITNLMRDAADTIEKLLEETCHNDSTD
jgi:hypothetical protein